MSVYYVTATGSCPTANAVCHPLSYYTDSLAFNWPSYLTLVFLPGEYNMTASLDISHLTKVIIRGGEDSALSMHSKPVITCNKETTEAFDMFGIKELLIKGLKVDCLKLKFHAISNLTLFDVFAQGIQVGFDKNHVWYADWHITISKSVFTGIVELYTIRLFLLVSHTTVYGGKLYFFSEGDQGEITLTNVSVFNSFDCGIELYCGRYCVMNFKDVIVDTCNAGLFVHYEYGSLYLTNVVITNGTQWAVYNHGYNSTTVLNNVTISNNRGGGMLLFDIYLIFHDHPSTIMNNHSPTGGGGLKIVTQYSAINGNTRAYFINNTAGTDGGAIYFAREVINTNLTCSFGKRFTPIFTGNSALLAGNDIYNGVYWNCTTIDEPQVAVGAKNDFNMIISCSDNPSLKSFPKPVSSHVTSDALGVCLCSIDSDSSSAVETNCSIRNYYQEFYPGQLILLPLVTVGVCGGISPAVLVTESEIIMSLNTMNQKTDQTCSVFGYRIKQNSIDESVGKIEFKAQTALQAIDNSSLIIDITLLPCPHGLALSNGMCQCNSIISSVSNVRCNIDLMPHPISKSSNSWLYYNTQYDCTVGYVNCPFDYCNSSTISFSLDDPDIQCTNNRSGILCGACQQGLSLMLGSNRCGQCSNKYISLILPFIVAGIILVAFLLVSNMTVSVGSINGLLFYANVMKLNESANGISIPVLSQFIAWLNLDLGIETCFFNGLDGYWKTWLQYCFSFALIALLILCCKLSTKLAHYLGRNVVAVLSTLIFMAHSKLLLAIRNSLMLSVIECEGRKSYVWSVDGNLSYLGHKHIYLFILSLVVMLSGLLYTITIFSSQWMQKLCGRYCRSSWDPFYRFKPFLDAYTGPYKDRYRYWTGLLLIIRLLLTTVFSYTTGTIPIINTYITVFIAGLLIHLLAKEVYRNKILNILELFYMVNLGITALLIALMNQFKLSFGTASITVITALSVSLSMAAFLITVVVHLYIVMNGYCCSKLNFTTPFQQFHEEEPLLRDNEKLDDLGAKREQLIFY